MHLKFSNSNLAAMYGVSPNEGSLAGGTNVVINGTGRKKNSGRKKMER